MSVLSSEDIDKYLKPMSEEQSQSIRAVRSLILEMNPYLVEEIDTGKWFGGLLTYHSEDRVFVFALGPLTGGFTTFHMMAYYCFKDLQERHGTALKKFLSGKSCMKFKRSEEVPQDALRDIIASTPKSIEVTREMLNKRKKK